MEHNEIPHEISTLSEHHIRCNKIARMHEHQINPWPMAKQVSSTTKQAGKSVETKSDEALSALRQAQGERHGATQFESVEGLHTQESKHQSERDYNTNNTLTSSLVLSPSKHTSEPLTLAGRLISYRDHGKSIFAHLQDREGTLQLYFKKEKLGDTAFDQFVDFIDIGDIIWVEGTLFTTKKGEITLNVTAYTLLSKCLHPLPEKYHGLANIEQRYRQRYLDLISNKESSEKFKKRSLITHHIRTFLYEHDFLEVETPMLHPIPGGATAHPFVTHHNTYNLDLYLRIAPELYLKRLVIGGFDRVFEINRNFRNEGISTKHNPEFTAVEFYMAHGDYHEGMRLTEQLFRFLVQASSSTLLLPFQDHQLDFASPFACMTIEEAVLKVGGFSVTDISPTHIDTHLKAHNIEIPTTMSHPEKIYALFGACVENKLIQPTFITRFPAAVSPLARTSDDDPLYTDRFELFIAGMELANGFSELNNPFDQAERFKSQVKAREQGDKEAHHYDHDYVNALEYGLPPTVGVGFGLDRLVMLLTNTTAIKDVILFPTLKPQNNDEMAPNPSILQGERQAR